MNNSEYTEKNMPPPLPAEEASPHNEPQDGDPNGHALAGLLKTPSYIMWRIRKDDRLASLTAQLLAWGLIFHAAYGFAMALFDSPAVAAITAAKTPLIALFSVLLCIPSLYVFSCVAGLPVRISQACALAASTVAMTGLLLLGMTPVTWLFSVSTNSMPFVVVMNVLSWIVAVGFAIRFFSIYSESNDASRIAGLKWWLFIYIIVSMQMATTMRPLISKAEYEGLTPGKKFFITHFKETIFEGGKPAANQQKGRR